MNVRLTITAMAAIAAIGPAMPKAGAQSTIALGYANQETLTEWGTQRAESYDVAIALTDPELVGKTIKGVKVPVVEGEGNIGWNVWITTKLKLKTQDGKRVNNPNVCSKDVTPVEGWIIVDFDEPYTITDDGAYVGVSFTATNSTKECYKPLMCSHETTPEGLYMRTSNSLTTWGYCGNQFNYTLGMQVIMEDNFPESALEVEKFYYSDSAVDGTPKAWIRVFNRCGRTIESIDYNYTIGDKSGTMHLDLDEPITGRWGYRTELHLPVCEMPKGIYDVTIEITKVNGKENVAERKSAGNKLAVHNALPVKRPLIEEYTGTWCGWCPRGYVAMEMLRDKYPESVIVCYHGGDPMQMAYGNPSMAGGYPRAFVDRDTECDPYTGSYNKPFGIEQDWLKRCEEFSPVALNVTADFDGSQNNKITATTTMEWVRTPDDTNPDNYRLEYILLHDGLHGTSDSWGQINYYCGSNTPDVYKNDKNLAEFVNNEWRVDNLRYNDVAVLTSGGFGIEGSIETIEAENETTHSYTFNLANDYNASGTHMIQDKKKLRVVAVLLYVGNDRNGEVVNAAKCELPGYDGVESTFGDADIVATEWHDLQGRRIDAPSRGICIKTSRYSDGSRRSEKILIKE